MKEFKGEVVTVVTVMGEIVGRVKNVTGDYVSLKNPRLFMRTNDGVGFAPGICVSGESNPSEAMISMSTVVTICKTNDEIAKGWIEQTSGLIV